MGWNSWLMFHKSAPFFVVCWCWVLYSLWKKSLPEISITNVLLTLLAGVLFQLGGDLNFQLALGQAGLATTIPVNFCCLIITGALFSRFWLNEPLTRSTIISQFVLIIAITCIGISRGALNSVADTNVLRGILHAVASGISFGSGGVLVRYLSPRQPVLWSIFLVTFFGTPLFGIYGVCSLGIERISAIPWPYMLAMWLAGLANCSAFYIVLCCTRYLPTVMLNSISSTQIIMSAVAGILIFTEPASAGLYLGIALTILGLLIISIKKKKRVPLKSTTEKGLSEPDKLETVLPETNVELTVKSVSKATPRTTRINTEVSGTPV